MAPSPFQGHSKRRPGKRYRAHVIASSKTIIFNVQLLLQGRLDEYDTEFVPGLIPTATPSSKRTPRIPQGDQRLVLNVRGIYRSVTSYCFFSEY